METQHDVAEDSELVPEEKQVSIVACKDQSRFRVHSEVASVTRALLSHSEFDRESSREVDGETVAVTGTIPVRYLSVGTGGRNHDNWGGLVSSR